MIRVVLTGSESTGKTTLASALATYFDAELVPEFVRDYAASKNAPLDFSDHGPIAKGQIALEDAHIARATSVVVQDTDLLSTVLYCEHYFGRCPMWIVEASVERRPELYLLCEIDIPWVEDGIRDRGHLREEMQQLFRDAVAASGVAVVVIHGSHDHRFHLATEAIEELLLDGRG